MISDCKLHIMTQNGIVELPFLQAFDGKLHLKDGEFLVSISIDQSNLDIPYSHVKKTRIEKIDYPLISMAATKNNTKIRAAITGYGVKPFLLPEKILNHKSYGIEKKIERIISQMHNECKSDLSGSCEYREFVLQNILQELLINFRTVDFIVS